MQSKFGLKKLQLVALVALLLTVALGVLSVPANADNLYASIRGTVTDSTGAVVSGVKMTATNSATGISYSTTSNSDGVFNFLQVAIGDYTVRAEQPGFKKFQASGIHVDLNQTYNLPVSLTVGAVSEEIIVEANPVQVQQTDIQLGTTVSGDQIVDIPLNGRNWTQLQQLQPGVVATTDRFGGGGGGYSGNGAQTQQNSFLINGNDSNDQALNTVLVVPSPDAIGEFRMITSTINPEYGRNSGTIINAAIKNGTNKFHGDAFEFYRDTFMDAKAWFRQTASIFHQNQFGGTIGGPVVKDRTFFFFSFQGLKNRSPENAASDVPVFSDAQRGGDFSAQAADFGSNLSPFPLYGDNSSACPVSNAVQCPAGTAYNSLFSTGIIPTQDFNPLSFKLMQQFVPPANSGTDYLFNPTTTQKQWQYIYRIDEKLTNSDALWFYGLYQTTPISQTIPFTGATLPGFGSVQTAHVQQYAASWTHTFSPTTLNEARVGFTRLNFHAVTPANPLDPVAYGFTGISPQIPGGNGLPVMTVGTLFTLGFSSNGPQPRVQNVYQFVDNLSKVVGHHTIKIGFNSDVLQINNPFYNNLSGNFSFNASGPFSSGYQGADFLLGIPDTYTQGSGSVIHGRGKEFYSYIQDQWQVRPNLTLTIGTGYDVETPWINTSYGGEIMAAFRAGQQSGVFPSMPTGFVYPGDAGMNKYGGMKIHYDNLAPRAGFVWSPKNNWSIHAGIGMYYNRSEEELTLQSLTNPPFALTSIGAGSLGTSPSFTAPFTSVNTTTVRGIAPGTVPQPFPFTPPPPGQPFPSTLPASTFYPIGVGMNTSDPNMTSPRTVNYNLTIEHQISKSTIVSLGYVGNVGRHEEGAYNLNQAGQFPGANPAAAASGCPSGLFLHVAAFGCPQTPANAPPGSVPGATPFPLAVYGQTGVQATGYNSKYNSLQATFNRRFSNGLQVLAGYTWSRYFDQTSNLEASSFNFPGINPFDPRDMWAPSQNDAPQRFVVSYVYTLPIYKWTHVAKRLTDGWNLSGIYTLQHGNPVPVLDFFAHTLTCDNNGYAFYACPDRVNWAAPLHFSDPRTNQTPGVGQTSYWFTNGTSALVPGAPGTGVGNAPRNPLYGPGINYSDLAIEKNINIDEARSLQLRLETYNTFNHANFANPANFGSSEDASILDASNFGQIFGVKQISTNGDGRVIQLGLKFMF